MSTFDILSQLSDNQAFGSGANVSDKWFDMALAVAQHQISAPLWLCIRVGVAPTALTSVAFQLENDKVYTFNGANILTFPLRAAINKDDLTIGKWVYRGVIPYEAIHQFSRLVYTVDGTAETVGKVNAWVQKDPPLSDRGRQIYVSNVGNP